MVSTSSAEKAAELKKEMTHDPLLVIHKDETRDDREAKRLLSEVLGHDNFTVKKVAGAEEASEIVPHLFIAASVCRGLKNIEGFVRYVRRLDKRIANVDA